MVTRITRYFTIAGMIAIPGLMLSAGAASAQSQTLADVLRYHSAALPSHDSLRAKLKVHSAAVGSSHSQLVIAYHVTSDTSSLPLLGDSLYLSVLSRRSGAWRHAAARRTQPPGGMFADGYTAGSAVRVGFTLDHIWVDTHLTPSAGTLLVFDRELTLTAALNGWSEAVLASGTTVYQRSTVHFAPTHPAELRLFTPATGADIALYPTQPYDSVRHTYIDRVRQLYDALGNDWFRQHNQHMMADRFTSSIGNVVADSTGRGVAFIAHFGDDGANRASPPVVEVLVVCNGIPRAPQCMERLMPLVRLEFPGLADEKLLLIALASAVK